MACFHNWLELADEDVGIRTQIENEVVFYISSTPNATVETISSNLKLYFFVHYWNIQASVPINCLVFIQMQMQM